MKLVHSLEQFGLDRAIDMAYKDQIMHGLQLLQEYVKTKKDNQSNEMGE